MPGRVELHLVDSVAEAVVGPQHRRMLVRLTAPLLGLGRTGQAAEFAQAVLGPARALAAQRVEHRGVRGDVVPSQRRRLIEHLVGRCHRRAFHSWVLFSISTLYLYAGGPIAATTRVTGAAVSISAPSTSPVLPPSRRTACRCRTNAAARPATTASGSV